MEQEPSPAEDRAGLEVVFTANGEIEAQTIKSALIAAGIPAELKMEAAQQLFAVTVNGLGAVKVMVPADRLEEARTIVNNPAAPIEEADQSE
jgi:hypothetical protein